MPLQDKSAEIERLVAAFEKEAGSFHDIQFHTYHISQDGGPVLDRKFSHPNHAIMLWQHYGSISGDTDIDDFVTNLQESSVQWGLRGSALTFMGVIEGEATPLFVRMASRAGSLFDSSETHVIKSRILNEIQEEERTRNPHGKPTSVTNDNPLAIWLNFLLYHLSLSNPGRERSHRIEPDPFTLSLLALERLADQQTVEKVDRSNSKLADLRFKVALSFPGEKRRYVSRVVNKLRESLGPDSVFYDFDYQAQLARPNLDVLLQTIYHDQSELIVVFLCAEYAQKQWCGLEWRAVRDIIKAKQDDRVMFVRFDDASIDGLLTIDGYIDGSTNTARQVAEYILTRVAEIDS